MLLQGCQEYLQQQGFSLSIGAPKQYMNNIEMASSRQGFTTYVLLLMIQSILRRWNTIPVQSQFVFRVGIRHLRLLVFLLKVNHSFKSAYLIIACIERDWLATQDLMKMMSGDHLTIISPPGSAFPYILDRKHAFCFHLCGALLDAFPDAKHVLSHYQRQLLFRCTSI